MVLIGAGERSRGLGAAAVASVALCAGLYPLYRDTLHRFLSVCSAIALVAGWIVISHAPPDTLHVLVLGEVAGLALLFTRFSTARGTRPLAYALAASLPWTLFLFAVADFRIGAADWPSRIILGAAFVALVVWAAGGIASLSREPIRLAVGAAILLSLVGISGVLASLGLLILGYARWDRFLLALGGAWLPAFLFAYYYDLKVDLLQKSIWLGASGAVMLAACAVISMRPWARREAA
jgi:hypothetical protein